VLEVLADDRREPVGDLVLVGGEVEDRDATRRERRDGAGDDRLADELGDLLGLEPRVGADQLAQQYGWRDGVRAGLTRRGERDLGDASSTLLGRVPSPPPPIARRNRCTSSPPQVTSTTASPRSSVPSPGWSRTVGPRSAAVA
jgi:hypothetical protein